MPSFNLYRGALLVMLIGTAVAIFLLVRPPGETDGSPPVVGGALDADGHADGGQRRDAGARADIRGEHAGDGRDRGRRMPDTPGAEVTPPAATPTPTEEPGEATFREYVVVEGDTLFGIAEATMPPGDDIDAVRGGDRRRSTAGPSTRPS